MKKINDFMSRISKISKTKPCDFPSDFKNQKDELVEIITESNNIFQEKINDLRNLMETYDWDSIAENFPIKYTPSLNIIHERVKVFNGENYEKIFSDILENDNEVEDIIKDLLGDLFSDLMSELESPQNSFSNTNISSRPEGEKREDIE